MTLKLTILAAAGALLLAAPVAAQAHHWRHHHYAERHHCGFVRRYEYGVFGRYRKRWTVGCD